jgi:antitoxin HicB
MRYAVTLTPDESGTLLVTVPDLPEALTFGEDRADALVPAIDAIETALMAAMAAREDIAEPKASGSEHSRLNAIERALAVLGRSMTIVVRAAA